MLTATGLVNGRGQLSIPAEPTPLDRSPKKLIQAITSAPLRLCQIWCKCVHGGFWENRWNITKKFLNTFIYTFFRELRPVDGFSRCGLAQRKGVPFRVSLILFHILGVKYLPKTIFRAWIAVFKPNGQNIESFILSKLLHRFQLKLCRLGPLVVNN